MVRPEPRPRGAAPPPNDGPRAARTRRAGDHRPVRRVPAEPVDRQPPTLVRTDHGVDVFLFFSNRLGCFGSILVSIVVTVLLVLLFRWL